VSVVFVRSCAGHEHHPTLNLLKITPRCKNVGFEACPLSGLCFGAFMRIAPIMPTGRGPRWHFAAVASALAIAAGLAWIGARGLRHDPDRVRVNLRDDLLRGRVESAEESLAWLAGHDRLTPPDLMARARVAQLRGRPDEALAALADVAGRDAVAARARLMAGLIQLDKNRARLAEASLRQAVEIDPELRQARYELIQIYGRQQRRAALDEQYHALIGRGLDVDRLMFWAMSRNAAWNAASDTRVLESWVEADPGDRDSRLALASGLRGSGRVDRALEVLVPLGDSDADALALRAQIALDRGEREEAARLLAGPPPSHAGLSRLRGLLALSRSDARTAVRELVRACRLDPDDRQTIVSLGIALTLAGEADAARPILAAVGRLRAYDEVVARLGAHEGDGPALYQQIGAAAEAVGRRAEAAAWYGLTIARDPLRSDAQQALFRLGPSATDAPPVDFEDLPIVEGPR
jgi:Flp pilus assembly protein TadD